MEEWPQDEQIYLWIQDLQKNNGSEWTKSIFTGCSLVRNPLFSDVANQFALLPWFEHNPIVNLFSDKMLEIKYSNCCHPPIPEHDNRSIPFQSDLPHIEIAPNSMNQIPLPPSHSFWIGKKKNVISPPIQLDKVLERKTSPFIFCEITDFKSKLGLFEPIFGVGFLFNGKNIVSENWYFVPDPTVEYFRRDEIEYNPNSKAMFQNFNDPELFLVISLYHPMTFKQGETQIEAYLKSKDKDINLAMAEAKISKDFGVKALCPLGYSFASVKALAEGMPFPKIHVCKEPITSEMLKSAVQESSPLDPRVLSFDVSVKAEFMDMEDDDSIRLGAQLVGYLRAPVPEPVLSFRHEALLRVKSACLKAPFGFRSQSFYFTIEYKNGNNTTLPLIVEPYTGKGVEITTSVSASKARQINFDELITIRLPLKIDPTAALQIKFFVAAKISNQLQTQHIGTAFLKLSPLKEGETVLTVNDPSNLNESNILYEANSRTPMTVSLKLSMRSLVIPATNELKQFYNTAFNHHALDIDALKKVDPATLVRCSLPLVDALVKCNCAQPVQSIEALLYIASHAKNVCPRQFERFLMIYAIYFAYTQPQSRGPEFHRALLDAWIFALRSGMAVNGGQREDMPVMDFLFLLVIKSIAVNGGRQFQPTLNEFFTAFAESTTQMNLTNHPQTLVVLHSYSLFLALLFDVGHYGAALNAIATQVMAFPDTIDGTAAATFFLESALRPRMLAAAALYSPPFLEFLARLVRVAAARPDLDPLQRVFKTLMRCFACISDEVNAKIAGAFFPLIGAMADISRLPFANGEHACVAFFVHVVGTAEDSALAKYLNSCGTSLFRSMHYALECTSLTNQVSLNIPKFTQTGDAHTFPEEQSGKREFAFSTQNACLQLLKQLVKKGEKEEADLLFYHLMCTDLVLQLIDPIIELYSQFATENVERIFNANRVPFVKILKRIIELSTLSKSSIQFLSKLTEAEKIKYSNSNRTKMLICRILPSLDTKILEQMKAPPNEEFEVLINYRLLNELLKDETLPIERRAHLMFSQYLLLIPSPDSACGILDQIAAFHHENEYEIEEIYALLLEAAIIAEYLGVLGKLPQTMPIHGSAIFKGICPSSQLVEVPSDVMKDLPTISGFCDSSKFNVYALSNLLRTIMRKCHEAGLYEITTSIIDILWPLLEGTRAQSMLSDTLMIAAKAEESLSMISPEQERFLGMYYRVAFYGKNFVSDDGCVYIYREKKITSLFEFTERLTRDVEKAHPKISIEIIRDAGAVDQTKLDPETCYIQVTSVLPFFSKAEKEKRKTVFELHINLSRFYIETPFIPGNNKAQGSIDKQWIRRTVFSVETPMPYTLKRQKVRNNGVETKEKDPARFSLAMLKDRVAQLRSAVSRNDSAQVQQLLHGSLLVQVNEGPAKIAEVFLSEKSDTKAEPKTAQKMKAAFSNLISACEDGLQVHAAWVAANPAFFELHRELEGGLAQLRTSLSMYL